MNTLIRHPTSSFSFSTENEKHQRLEQLIERIKTSKDLELIDTEKKDYIDLILTIKHPTKEELDVYDELITEILNGEFKYNIIGVTDTPKARKVKKKKSQKSLADYL